MNSVQIKELMNGCLSKIEEITNTASGEKRSLNDQENQEVKKQRGEYNQYKSQLESVSFLEEERRSMSGFVAVPAANDDGEKRALGSFAKTGELRYLGKGTANGDAELARSTTYAKSILTKADQVATMRSNASVVSVTGESFTDTVGKGGVVGGWGTEGAATADKSDLKIAQRKTSVHRLDADPEITVETANQSDIVNLENWVTDRLGYYFGTMQDSAFWTGDGSGKPKGLLHSDYLSTADIAEGDELDKIKVAETKDNTTDVTADDLIDIVADLKPIYRLGAKWYFSNERYKFIAKLKDSNGDYIMQKPVDKLYSTLLGYEVVVVDALEGKAEIVFANMGEAYQVVDQSTPINIQRDTLTKRGFVRFPSYLFVGGSLRSGEAAKVVRKKPSAAYKK